MTDEPNAGAGDPLLDALRNYQQADYDGVLVLVSRQACDEAAAELTRLRAALAEAERERGVLLDTLAEAQRSLEALSDEYNGRMAAEARAEAAERVVEAAKNLVKVKGRHHSEQAYAALVAAIAAKGE